MHNLRLGLLAIVAFAFIVFSAQTAPKNDKYDKKVASQSLVVYQEVK